jgi:hypothetical protein
MPDSGRPTLTKSCQACVIAKRKCSRTLPQCQRCKDKGIICKYRNQPFSTDNNSTTWFLGSHSDGPTPADSIQHDQRRGLVLASRSNTTVLSLDRMLLDAPAVILTFDQPTVNYLTDHLRTFPMAFVRNGGTLFIHRQLYQDGLPDTLQDIFALCAMDIHHSQANQHIISRAISSTAIHLIQSIPSTHTFISKLAFVQSLILLQIMTLFCPTVDQALRQQAERRMPLLKVWAVKLYQ